MTDAPTLTPSRLRPGDLARVASVGLRTRRVRAGLSALGIAIGVATIVAVLGLSSSSQAGLLAEIDHLGTNDLFLGLGAVALLVGAVGVANIMIISVLERRSEIGLRRALGATKGQIRAQFLLEAVLLAMLGGLAGVGAGVLATAVYASTKGWTVVIPPLAWAAGSPPRWPSGRSRGWCRRCGRRGCRRRRRCGRCEGSPHREREPPDAHPARSAARRRQERSPAEAGGANVVDGSAEVPAAAQGTAGVGGAGVVQVDDLAGRDVGHRLRAADASVTGAAGRRRSCRTYALVAPVTATRATKETSRSSAR